MKHRQKQGDSGGYYKAAPIVKGIDNEVIGISDRRMRKSE